MDEIFYAKLKDLLPFYEKVRAAIITLETFSEKQEMYIAPINEMRNALDHLFKAIKSSDDLRTCENEFQQIKEHMGRAGHDALDLLSANLGIAVNEKLDSFDVDTIVTVLPEYYTKIKPKITELRKNTAKSRIERNMGSDKYFSAYLGNIEQIMEINNMIDMRIPSLIEFREKRDKEKQEQEKAELKKKKNERLWQYFIGPIIGFVSAAIIALLAWFLTN